MIRLGAMCFARINTIALSLVVISDRAAAQTQPAMIPTVVAQASSLESSMFGRPQYFDGRTPTDWPEALIPAGAKVIGGSRVGDPVLYRMQTAVFELSGGTDANEMVRALLTRAGYVRQESARAQGVSGFVESEPTTLATRYCKGPSLATFGAVDPQQAPLVMAIHLLDGDAGRQNCAPRPDRSSVAAGRHPVTVPALSPPSGVLTFGGGSSWSDASGDIRSTLRTTMPPDSLLAHYAQQLVTGGWKAEGRPAFSDGIAVQRFTFRQNTESWAAAMVIVVVGEKRTVRIMMERAP